MSSSPKVLFGFHAVGVRIKTAPKSVLEVFYDVSRRDARMRQFTDRARDAGIRLIESDGLRLAKMCGSHGHQGVVARVNVLAQVTSLDELLEQLEEAGTAQPLLLVLDWSPQAAAHDIALLQGRPIWLGSAWKASCR